MKFPVLTLLAAVVTQGAIFLPPHQWEVKLDRPVEDALTGKPVKVVDGHIVVIDEDDSEAMGRRKRIISGQVARPGEYKSMCSLQLLSQGTWYHICGCFVYSADTIVTAAHCVDGRSPSDLRVRSGEFNLRVPEGTEQTIAVGNILMNPNYSPDPNQGYPNDVALLTLASSLTFDDFVQAAAVASAGETFAGTCKLVGWGETAFGTYPDELNDVSIAVLTNAECNSRWTNLIKNVHICFKDGFSLDGACSGDSGGHSICGGKVVGVTSWGLSTCRTFFYPSVYTRLSEFESWMKANAA